MACAGGLLLSAALAFAVVLIGLNNIWLLPAILVVLAMAGASLGYLPFNWPSSLGKSWRAWRQTARAAHHGR